MFNGIQKTATFEFWRVGFLCGYACSDSSKIAHHRGMSFEMGPDRASLQRRTENLELCCDPDTCTSPRTSLLYGSHNVWNPDFWLFKAPQSLRRALFLVPPRTLSVSQVVNLVGIPLQFFFLVMIPRLRQIEGVDLEFGLHTQQSNPLIIVIPASSKFSANPKLKTGVETLGEDEAPCVDP